MLVKCTGAGVSFGAQRIFEQVSLAVEPKDRIALIGPNGAGKTTLLGLITGELSPDEGETVRRLQLRIGYLKQNGGLLPHGTIESETSGALGEVFAVEQALAETAAAMASTSDHAGLEYRALTLRYQELEARFAALDGYQAQVKISTVLTAMGFGSFDRKTPVSTLSGGEQTRLMLCRLLLEEPELLILDEATNHLDFKMLAWLEDYLLGYRGAILTVSHDRYFLERVTQTTWELENKTVVCYPAPYSGYTALRAERLARLEKEYERHLQEAARLREYAERNIARASTSAGAKSRLKALDRLGEATPPPVVPRAPLIRFTPALRPVSDILRVTDLAVCVGEGEQKKVLLEDFSLHIGRGERVAVIGENGAGKSTLLRTLLHPPENARKSVEWGRNTRVSFFEQESAQLHPDRTALMELWDRFPSSSEHALRSLLGGLGLTGDAVFKPTGVLSGGERARVKLALLTLEQGNVLVLDEPTNHLDIPAKEALEAALLAFEGTVLVVSHDRWLLSRLPTRIIRLENGRAESFEGGFEQMLSQLAARGQDKPAAPPPGQTQAKQQFYRSRAQRSAEAAARRRCAEVEREIEACESGLSELRGRMQSPQAISDYPLLCALGEETAALERRLEALYAEWDTLTQDQI